MSQMQEQTITVPKAPAAEHPQWSVGTFSAAGARIPAACLEHCLGDDPGRAATHGCAMLKHLVDRAADGQDDERPPSVCGQGYAVALASPRSGDVARALLLHTPFANEHERRAAAPAIELIQSTLAENARLTEENGGLADEVLRGYEQLNLIFEISAQIAILNEADEVRRLLLTKLLHLFDAEAIYYTAAESAVVLHVNREGEVRRGRRVRGDDGRTFVTSHDPSKPIDLPPEYERVREQFTRSQRVVVTTSDPGAMQAGRGSSLWGAIKEGGNTPAIVGIIRREKWFVAGDMLVLDSVLSYGGYILSNLRLVEQLKRTSFEAVRALVNAVDQKDSYTCGHSERVGFLAKLTGRQLGLSPRQQQELEWAGLLHDVGKIGIPEHVLNKPGRLTDEEFALIKEHPARSHEVLRPVASLYPILEGVLYHHENCDGTGYPCGLKGNEIPLTARIIHVVDVFDALTSTRSYREAFEIERAIGILTADAGTKLDAEVVDAFLEVWRTLPTSHPEQYERMFGSGKEESP